MSKARMKNRTLMLILIPIMAVVLVGIYIPARSISRIPPTEALREE